MQQSGKFVASPDFNGWCGPSVGA